jgi:hypothetical protein
MFDESIVNGDYIYPDDDSFSSVRFKIRLPWYRSLTASCIEGIDVQIDGAAAARGDLRLTLYGSTHSLDEVSRLHEVLWFVRHAMDLHVRTAARLTVGPHDVKVVMRLRIPYGKGFFQIAECSRRLTLVGRDWCPSDDFAGSAIGTAAVAKAASPAEPFQMGVTLYSFNDEYYHYRYSLQDCLEKIASLGPGTGVELVGPQMVDSWPEISEEFEKTFKSLVERYELLPTAYGGYADPERVTGHSLTDEENAEYIRLQIRTAKKLGFPILRGGRSDLAGYAEKMGVRMGQEIHSPNIIESPQTQRLIEEVDKVNSPFVGLIPDFGCFAATCAKPYVDKFTQLGVPAEIRERIVSLWEQKTPLEQVFAEVEAMGGSEMARLMALESNIYFGHGDPKAMKDIMPHIIHCHGKFFGIDPETGEEPAVRYAEAIAVLKEGGFSGSMSSEYEGHHWMVGGDALWQVKAHQAMVRRLLANV